MNATLKAIAKIFCLNTLECHSIMLRYKGRECVGHARCQSLILPTSRRRDVLQGKPLSYVRPPLLSYSESTDLTRIKSMWSHLAGLPQCHACSQAVWEQSSIGHWTVLQTIDVGTAEIEGIFLGLLPPGARGKDNVAALTSLIRRPPFVVQDVTVQWLVFCTIRSLPGSTPHQDFSKARLCRAKLNRTVGAARAQCRCTGVKIQCHMRR